MKRLSKSSLLLMVPFFLQPLATMAEEAPAPAVQKTSYLGFGTRLGEGVVEGYTDLIFPLFATPSNTFFLNPRFSIKDEGENEANIGLGYRRKLTDWLVGGANVYFDSRESEHGNRFNQWGAGMELFSDYVDFRANYYDADNSKERIGSYGETSVSKSSRTTASSSTRSSTTSNTHGAPGGTISDPYAEGHAIYLDITGKAITDYITTATTTTTYRTTTTTTTTQKLFEQFEAGMDGWDAELGFKIPTGKGPEVRLYGGYYDYDNPLGDDLSGLKGRLELKTGKYFTLDAEVFEDEELNDSNYFVGFRLQVPLSGDLNWQKFKQGLFTTHHPGLDERMRSEMVMRDVRVQTQESDWQENEEKRQVDIAKSVSRHTTTSTKTTSSSETIGKPGETEKVKVADHITFVDGDTSGDEDGTNERPYKKIQDGVDNAGDNNTIFVYEAGGTATGKPGPGDGGGTYDEQVVLQEGQTLTSTVSWTSHGGGSYQTQNRPIVKPTEVTVTHTISGDERDLMRIAPVITMADQTTVQRMNIDATDENFANNPDPVVYRRSAVNEESSENLSTGLFYTGQIEAGPEEPPEERMAISRESSPEPGQSITLRIEDNLIATSKESSPGILLNADLTENSRIDIIKNSISTTGDYSPAITISAIESEGMIINASQIDIITKGDDSFGIFIDAFGSKDTDIQISETSIITEGEYSLGMFIDAGYSTAADIQISETDITTEGEYSWVGMGIFAYDSTNADIEISGTDITTEGEYSTGMGIDAYDSTAADIQISETDITTEGKKSPGMFIYAYDSTDADIHISGTDITTEGDDSVGMGIGASSNSIDNTIKDNTLTINGSNSWGIYVEDDTAGSFNQTDLEAKNTFSIADSSSHEVQVLP